MRTCQGTRSLGCRGKGKREPWRGLPESEKTGNGAVDEMQKNVASTISTRKQKRKIQPNQLSTVNRCLFAECLCLGKCRPSARKSVTVFAILHAFEGILECAMGGYKKCAKRAENRNKEKRTSKFVKKSSFLCNLARSHTLRRTTSRGG